MPEGPAFFQAIKRLTTVNWGDTFSNALRQNQKVRVYWLSVLRAQTRNGGPVVDIAPEDNPLLHRLETLLPDDPVIRLNAFIIRLSFHAPEIFEHAPRPVLDSWLTEIVLKYQARRYPDPLKPRGPRGRTKGSGFLSNEELYAQLLLAIRHLRDQGDYPSQAKVMAQMGVHGEPRRVREWLARLHIPFWTDLLHRA
jgi:hypothetical protein